MSNPVEKLTRAEKDALRLVARDRSVGEIASILGKSPYTVGTQIKTARSKLGGVPAFVAARLLAEAEGRTHSLATLTFGIGETSPTEDQAAIDRAAGVAEHRAVFDVQPDKLTHMEITPARVSLTRLKRLFSIGGLAALIGIAVFLAVASTLVIQLLLSRR